MLSQQIPKLRARDQLAAMDAGVYGNRIHARKEDGWIFDTMRSTQIAAAKD